MTLKFAPPRGTDIRKLRGPLTRRRQASPTAVLLVAGFGAFLAFLDSTIVNIAIPDIQKYFHNSDIGAVSWVLNAYNIAFAAMLVPGGRLADLLGRKRTFIYGIVSFTTLGPWFIVSAPSMRPV